jgi:hypothetical protein
MQKITIPNYVPTVNKAQHHDLEVTYTIEDDGVIVIDEVFCNGGNITELLTETTFSSLSTEVKVLLKNEEIEARLALRTS